MFYLCCWGWGTAMYAYVWLNQVQSSTHTCVLVVLVVLSYFIKLQVLHFAWPAQTTLYFSILGPPIIWGGPHFADLLYFLPTEKIHSESLIMDHAYRKRQKQPLKFCIQFAQVVVVESYLLWPAQATGGLCFDDPNGDSSRQAAHIANRERCRRPNHWQVGVERPLHLRGRYSIASNGASFAEAEPI